MACFYDGEQILSIHPDKCIDCEACVHLPQKKTNPYAMLVYPWDAIEMVPTEQVAQVVADIGGPPEYICDNWDRLAGAAQHLAKLKAPSQEKLR